MAKPAVSARGIMKKALAFSFCEPFVNEEYFLIVTSHLP